MSSEFSGGAADIIDSASFESGQGRLDSFPLEPAVEAFDYSIIPGHLGQLWLGNTPNHFFTVTKAELTFNNELVLRNHEFGSMLPRGIMPGIRDVSLDLAFSNKTTRTQRPCIRQLGTVLLSA